MNCENLHHSSLKLKILYRYCNNQAIFPYFAKDNSITWNLIRNQDRITSVSWHLKLWVTVTSIKII